MYPSFAKSCDSDAACANEGWAVLLYAVLSELGHPQLAMERTLALPEEAFTSAGGGGHSLTNSLWYISARPAPVVPYDLQHPSTSTHSKAVPESEKEKKIDCGCPDTCTSRVLSTNTNVSTLLTSEFTCKEHIQWLMTNEGLDELGACKQVAGNKYESECGACDPELSGAGLDTSQANGSASSGCPPCNVDVCNSEMSRCQITTTPYLCYEGAGSGGCSATPWATGGGATCSACCELLKGCGISARPALDVHHYLQNPASSPN